MRRDAALPPGDTRSTTIEKVERVEVREERERANDERELLHRASSRSFQRDLETAFCRAAPRTPSKRVARPNEDRFARPFQRASSSLARQKSASGLSELARVRPPADDRSQGEGGCCARHRPRGRCVKASW